MAISLGIPSKDFELKPRITVVGAGGAGGNAVNNMIRSKLEGVEFVVANTDAQALGQSVCLNRIQLGSNITRGLGAGSRPDIGAAAADEALDEIMEYLHGSNMVFVTAGMGGGTGTGAAPVIARAARECGILTIGVVTKPFHFEGAHRMRLAESGINELQQVVDTLIIIPNQNLFRVANERTTMADAFKMADDVLYSGVRGITDLMMVPGLVNLDFADIRTVMMEMGKAMMGTGEAEGDDRARQAAEAAISNPLLDDVSMKGAKGVLINITGGNDITLYEIDEAANRIRQEVDPDANIIFGSTFDDSMTGKIRLSIVATGIDTPAGIRATSPEAMAAASEANAALHTQQQSATGYHYQKPVRRIAPASASTLKPSLRVPQKIQPATVGESMNAAQGAVVASGAAPRETIAPQSLVKGGVFIAASAVDTDIDMAGDFGDEMDDGGAFHPAESSRAPAPAADSSAARPSLFGRVMAAATGSGSAQAQPSGKPSSGNAKVSLAAENPPKDSNLDIPAFLRRQAN